MDSESLRTLADLLRAGRVAALGSLRNGAPQVSMVQYVTSHDLCSFYLHLSRLAHHTRNIFDDPRVSLMVAEADTGVVNPGALARVSLQGEATEVQVGGVDYVEVRSIYLERFPKAAINFELGDFHLFRVVPREARYVAGFGRIYDLSLRDFRQAAEAKG